MPGSTSTHARSLGVWFAEHATAEYTTDPCRRAAMRPGCFANAEWALPGSLVKIDVTPITGG
jgi:hypothetical protein